MNRACDLDAQLDGDARVRRIGRHDSGTRRGRQVANQRRELGVGPGGQRAFQAVVQFFRGEPAVPGGYPQHFHHLIPVRV
jgi:hypothetical protein